MQDIEDLASDDHVPVPKWYPVKYAMTTPWDPKCGARILASFAKIDFHDEFAIPEEKVHLSMPMFADEL
jgi:hypothetical protein